MSSYKLARKSRKNKSEVYIFDLKMEENLLKMLDDLKNRKYEHGKYTKIILHDSKKRFIHSPNFRDHIFHHMMYRTLYEKLDKKFIFPVFACRKGFWNQKCILYIKKSINKLEKKTNSYPRVSSLASQFTSSLYYLKIDVSKYFYSINHDILEKILLQNIDDDNLKYWVKVFLRSYTTDTMFDELFDNNSQYIQNKNKWIPIGSIISQLFANFYLNNFDHFVKRKLKIKNYFRYMDDFLFIWTKKELKEKYKQILHFLKEGLYLEINPKKISFNLVSDWLSFVWYKIKKWQGELRSKRGCPGVKIYVWKRIIKGLQRFLVKRKELKTNDKLVLSKIENIWQSRRWFFDISDFGKNYIKKLNL